MNIDGYENFSDKKINDEEKTEIIKDADKLPLSSVTDLNTTTQGNTANKNSGFNQKDNANEKLEKTDMDMDIDPEKIPSENDIQNEDRLSPVGIESSQQVKANCKKNQNQVNPIRKDIYNSSNNGSNRPKYQSMKNETNTEEGKFNQDNQGYHLAKKENEKSKKKIFKVNERQVALNPNLNLDEPNHQTIPVNREITKIIPQNEDSKELKTTKESSNKSADDPRMELLKKTNKKREKYILNEILNDFLNDFVNLSTIFAVLNLIESINIRAKEKLEYKTDRIVFKLNFLSSKINEINGIYTYKDKTLFEFMVNFLKIPEKRIMDLLKKEEEKNKGIKLLYSLFYSKLSDILLMYLGFKTYPCVKYTDKMLLILKSYKTFKEQFNIKNFPTFKNEIYQILNNVLLNNEKKYIIPNIDGKGIAFFNQELSKFISIMEKELSNMLNSDKLKEKKEKKNENTKSSEEERSIVDYYSIRRVLFTCCKNSFNDYFTNLCLKYKRNRLHKLTIKPSLGHNFHKYRIFLNKKISQIYENFIPRKHKKDSSYDYTTKQIKKAIEEEKKANDNKIYQIYENAYFFDFFYAFLEDKNFIIIEDEKNQTFEILKLENFKTLKDYLVDGKFMKVEKEILKLENFKTLKDYLVDGKFMKVEKEILKKDMREILFEKIGRAERNK